MATGNTGVVSKSQINLLLPQSPPTNDNNLFVQLSMVYNAIRQIQNGVDVYLGIPSNPQTASYQLSMADRGISIDTTAGVTIPKESDTIVFDVGMVFVVTNVSNSAITITPATGVTIILAGVGSTGARTLSAWGIGSFRKLATDTWIACGAGLS